MYAGYYGQVEECVRTEMRLNAQKNTARVKEALADLLGLTITAFVIVTLLATLVLMPVAKKPVSRSAAAAVEVSADSASGGSSDIVLLSDADSN